MTGSYSRRPPLDGRVASTAHALVALSRIGKNVGVRKFGSARVDVRIQRKHDEKFLGNGDLPCSRPEKRTPSPCDATRRLALAVPTGYIGNTSNREHG